MSKFVVLILTFLFVMNLAKGEILEYDYSSTECIPIKLNISKPLSTKDDIIEGEQVEFIAAETVYYNGKLVVKKGDIIPARVETVITAGMNGFPAEIIVEDFKIPNIASSKLIGKYSKAGQNRCLWVYPLKWALTPLPPTGSLTNFIYGGHAKIKPSDIATIYYYPNWK